MCQNVNKWLQIKLLKPLLATQQRLHKIIGDGSEVHHNTKIRREGNAKETLVNFVTLPSSQKIGWAGLEYMHVIEVSITLLGSFQSSNLQTSP